MRQLEPSGRGWPRRPVNAPFSCPNSSLSSRPDGMSGRVHPDERPLAPRAQVVDRARDSSLPVPVSPSSSTVLSAGATVLIDFSTLRSATLVPMISANSDEVPARGSAFRRSSWALRPVDFLVGPGIFESDGDLCRRLPEERDVVLRNASGRVLPTYSAPSGPFRVTSGTQQTDWIRTPASATHRPTRGLPVPAGRIHRPRRAEKSGQRLNGPAEA